MTHSPGPRSQALSDLSAKLRELVPAMQALSEPSDRNLPLAMRQLLDAIDRVDVAAGDDAPVSPGTYIRLRREELGLTVDEVARKLDTDPDVSARRRAEWLVDIEADAVAISDRTAFVLHDAIGVDLRALAHWIAVAEAAKSNAGSSAGATGDLAA
jgi:hypothetical protein